MSRFALLVTAGNWLCDLTDGFFPFYVVQSIDTDAGKREYIGHAKGEYESE